VKNLALNWDLSDASVIDGLISKVEQELGPIDILINNTGGPPLTAWPCWTRSCLMAKEL
jgi:3-oxoacyl-[acyl-carrier protein] reductase